MKIRRKSARMVRVNHVIMVNGRRTRVMGINALPGGGVEITSQALDGSAETFTIRRSPGAKIELG